MILDTNIYSVLQDNKPELMQVLAAATTLALPLPVVAELKAGFANGTRRAQNEQVLEKFLDQSGVEVLYCSLRTADYYGDLQALCWKRGRALSQNDIWIAALALETGDTLVTYDNDFTVFAELLADKLVILS